MEVAKDLLRRMISGNLIDTEPQRAPGTGLADMSEDESEDNAQEGPAAAAMEEGPNNARGTPGSTVEEEAIVAEYALRK